MSSRYVTLLMVCSLVLLTNSFVTGIPFDIRGGRVEAVGGINPLPGDRGNQKGGHPPQPRVFEAPSDRVETLGKAQGARQASVN